MENFLTDFGYTKVLNSDQKSFFYIKSTLDMLKKFNLCIYSIKNNCIEKKHNETGISVYLLFQKIFV